MNRSDLHERLIADFPETGHHAWETIEAWLTDDAPYANRQLLESFLDHAPLEVIHESFYRILPFGTGGIRGPVGVGPNRINPTTVARTVQAHCDFLLDQTISDQASGDDPTIVIANDIRVFRDQRNVLAEVTDRSLLGYSSRDMALLAADVYSANGFRVLLMQPEEPRAYLTTPELSFLIRRLGAAGGVNMSASHNPPDDNGIKVYDGRGGQYLPPYDEDLTLRAQSVVRARIGKLGEAFTSGRLFPIAAEDLEAYQRSYDDVAEQQRQQLQGWQQAQPDPPPVRIVFTPLNGCGERTVGAVLSRLGYEVLVPDSQRAYGDFPTGSFVSIPLRAPNPEVEAALRPAKDFADARGIDLVLATDPDADRVGIEVKVGANWHHLNGNQIATVLAYRIMLDPGGPRLRGGVFTTIVTTRAVGAIARAAGMPRLVEDLLVGFKYVGGAVSSYAEELEAAGRRDARPLVLATEEAHGYLTNDRLRDKDGLSAAIYLADLHRDLARQGRSWLDYLAEIYGRVGAFGDAGRSLVIPERRGVLEIAALMLDLRTREQASLGGLPVVSQSDFRHGCLAYDDTRFASRTDYEAKNVLVYELEGARVTLRPSGTEPKLKFYVATSGDGGAGPAQAAAEEIALGIYLDLAGRLGRTLRRASAGLPDVLSIDAKAAFDAEVLPRLQELLASAATAPEVTSWLDEAVRRVVPGGDPLTVAWPAIEEASRSWGADARGKLGLPAA